MCGRFYIPADDTPEMLADLLAEAERTETQPLPRGEITPGMRVAALCRSRASGTAKAFPMTWGYTGQGRLLINARSETAAERPTFRDSLRARRCLIPAAAWFEWDHRAKPMAKFRIRRAAFPWFYLAGLYRLEDAGPRCTILTREAVAGLHDLHDRMPVTVAPQDAAVWLDPDADPAELLGRDPGPIDWQAEHGQDQQISLWG